MRLPELNQITGEGKSGVASALGNNSMTSSINPLINRDYPVIAHAARSISRQYPETWGYRRQSVIGPRCNYYDQNTNGQSINFCLRRTATFVGAPGKFKVLGLPVFRPGSVMGAIGAKFRLASTLGERMIEAAGCYNDDGIDYLKKRPDELLVEIHLRRLNGWRASYQKLRPSWRV